MEDTAQNAKLSRQCETLIALGSQPDIVLMILFALICQTTVRSLSRSLESIGIEWTYRTSEKMSTFLFLSSRFSLSSGAKTSEILKGLSILSLSIIYSTHSQNFDIKIWNTLTFIQFLASVKISKLEFVESCYLCLIFVRASWSKNVGRTRLKRLKY